MINLKIQSLVLLTLWIVKILTDKYSPLQITGHDISIQRVSTGTYTINLKTTQQDTSIPSIIYCMKQLATSFNPKDIVSPDDDCGLINAAEVYYTCIEVNFTNINNSTVSVLWGMFQFGVSGINQITKDSTNIQISSTNLSRIVTLKNNFVSDFKIYSLLTALSRNDLFTLLDTIPAIKINYFHTYANDLYFDTLIVQRNFYCHVHNTNIIYLFEGAVVRNGQNNFFIGILSTPNSTNYDPFHMWGGYSFSASHAARDMVGYESHTQKFYDLFSIYAAAPFSDEATNIAGEKNVVRISDSSNSSIANISSSTPSYHFIQFYRQFDTKDGKGDEILRQKIYNRHCFASYFVNYDPSKTYTFSVLNNSYMHDYISCHYPNLSLWGEENIKKHFIMAGLLLLLLFIN